MGFIVGLIVVIVVLALIGGVSRGGDMSYEQYRRTEYRNEYMWERKQSIEQRLYNEMIQFRHP